MELTQEEKALIMQQRVMEAKERNVYEEPTGYERGASMLGQVLQHAINNATYSTDESISAEAIKLATFMEGKYATWDEVVADTGFVNKVRDFFREASVHDTVLEKELDLIDSGMKDMGKSDADFRADEAASRNSFQEEDTWQRKTSNVDGETYVVNSDTGEYYSQEQWESNNTKEVQPHSLGWNGEEGVESSAFNDSLPSK